MRVKRWSTALVLAGVGLAAPPLVAARAAAAAEPGSRSVLDRRLSLSLERAPARRAFAPFEPLLELDRLELVGLSGEVSMRLDNVSARTVLNALCESLGCRWTLRADERLLEVRAIGSAGPGAEPALETPVTLSLEKADAFDVLIGFGKLLRSGVELELGTDARTVTIELDNRPIREALDDVCRQLDCRWRYERDREGAVLTFRGPGAERRRGRRGAG